MQSCRSYATFQSQTGSQALSDDNLASDHQSRRLRFNPKREARPSQTEAIEKVGRKLLEVSIPNGKPGPLRPASPPGHSNGFGRFQSQTGSQALSDQAIRPLSHRGKPCFNPKREARPSQTECGRLVPPTVGTVSIPNGKPGPLRRSYMISQHGIHGRFNPKREARPSQT